MSRLVALLVAGLGALVLVILLRQETMSVHTLGAPGSSTVVVVEASARPQRSTTRVAALARAQIALSRTEVHDETRQPNVVHERPWTFTFRLEPVLDESDRRQLHGCLEDAPGRPPAAAGHQHGGRSRGRRRPGRAGGARVLARGTCAAASRRTAGR